MVFLVLATATSCGGGGDSSGPGNGGGALASIILTFAPDSEVAGNSRAVLYTLKDADGNALTSKPLAWSSSDPNVATVSAAAQLTMHGPGTATITGTLNGISGQTTVKGLVRVATIVVSPDTASLLPGEHLVFSAVAKDQGGNVVAGRTIQWSGTPAALVTILASGDVTARLSGLVSISATSPIQPASGSATLHVLDSVAHIQVTSPTDSLLPGSTLQMTAVATKSNGGSLPAQPVAWSLSDSGLASISATGVLTAIAPGTVTVTAKLRSISGAAARKVLVAPDTLLFRPTPMIAGAGADGRLVAAAVDANGTTMPNFAATHLVQNGPVVQVAADGSFVTGSVGTVQVSATLLGSVAGSASFTVSQSLAFTSVTAGTHHNCGRTGNSLLLCWGEASFGRNGSGNIYFLTGPLGSANASAYTSVVLGDMHGCGLTAAGAVSCWGYANGPGSGTLLPLPLSGGYTFAEIDAGQNNTCGVANSGETLCWGGPAGGVITPNVVTMPAGVTLTSVSAGGAHQCGLTASGDAYCWGLNDDGRLGDGTTTPRAIPTLVLGGLQFTSVEAGYYHTCGIVTGGSVYCWGLGTDGQIGDGNLGAPHQPTLVNAPGVVFTSIELGLYFTCGISSTQDVYCWGASSYGQMGPTVIMGGKSALPVLIGIQATQVATGADHACGVTTGGLYCWGRNDSYELGTGAGVAGGASSTPLKVAGQP
jgi:hypothetical protein